MHYKTIIISDAHLGTKDAKSRELSKFLKFNSCDRLIMNGDMIDGWNLKRRGKWNKKDTRVFRRILKMMEDKKTEVIYIRGNHDDFLDSIVPLDIGMFSIVESYELTSRGKTYFVTHGDIFDVVSSKVKWLARLGDVGYKLLLWLNRWHNKRRRLKGLPYYSLSQEIKHKIKTAVSFMSDFEKVMVKYAQSRNYDGIICGHIHHPDKKTIEGIEYMNSGDWVESMSALVEDSEGNWSIVYYNSLVPENQQEIIFPE